jgi:hypothetical protein
VKAVNLVTQAVTKDFLYDEFISGVIILQKVEK